MPIRGVTDKLMVTAVCLLVTVCTLTTALSPVPGTPGFTVSTDTGFVPLRNFGPSVLYQVNGSFEYAPAPYLIDLHGERFDQGYAYGILLANEIVDTYNLFVGHFLPHKFLDEALFALVEEALDLQWNKYLSVQVPAEFKDELSGIQKGCEAVSQSQCVVLITRVMVLANAPADLEDFLYIIIDELLHHTRESQPLRYARVSPLLPARTPHISSRLDHAYRGQCSMLAVWGSRTAGGLYSARNLDWSNDTGINKYKLITVHRPPEPGRHAHATIGFVGLYGALAGMSAAGLTVHEANLEENEITFNGFPWILRLRYVMENAATLAEAQALWAATNNTVGFNHMVSSATDNAALVMETNAVMTAYFSADDPREEDAVYTDPKTNVTSHIGAPMPEALWRTNHGYDPSIRAHYLWGQSPNDDSIVRYFLIEEALSSYARNGVAIGDLQAMNVTAIVADKGKDRYHCPTAPDGSNVLSVVFHPTTLRLYAAWESGAGANWKPACCATYVLFDMKPWFGLAGR